MSTADVLLDPKAVRETLLPTLNKELTKIAQPILDQAMIDIEQAMKNKLGSMVIGILEHRLDVTRFEDQLHIVVHHKDIP